MKSLLEEIRQQPEHVRHVFMWTMVVITFSVVGFVWFRQTTKQFVALLHPEEAEARALAEKEEGLQRAQGKELSPFATIFDSMRDMRANLSELLAGSRKSLDISNGSAVPAEEQVPPQKLPISE